MADLINLSSLPHSDPVDLMRDQDLLIRHIAGTSDKLVVVFTGVAHGLGGVPAAEYVGSASCGGQNHVLFVSDLNRSWYSKPNISAKIADCISSYKRRNRISECRFLGMSMGGYGAIALTGLVAVDGVLSFNPQYTMHDATFVEPRWRKFRSNFGPELLCSLGDPIVVSNCQIDVVMGNDDARDQAQLALFPDRKNLKILNLADAGHNTALFLKNRNQLNALVSAFCLGQKRKFNELAAEIFNTEAQRPLGSG